MTEPTKTTCPSERWAALKARGNPTLREIEDIDNATPWKPREPTWWCEMMDVRKEIIRSAQMRRSDALDELGQLDGELL